ncbi:MAG: PQQ-binding-like beta-propeller repeat protein, partial [Planctomycetes bacterium]|nr:PQQ-binding-like beta-propeller repeat protein [Planctomycetota bacterium]
HWTGDTASGGGSGLYTAWDPNSGIIAHQWPSDTDVFFMHQRCHRSKATVRYLIPSRTGIEFVDPTTGHWDVNHWTRSGCVFGLVPSSGFVNITPHDCACYLQSKTFGFSAMAPAHSDPDYPHTPAPGLRTLPGPASGEFLDETPPGADDWPTYRGDTVRSGYIESVVPSEIALEWETPVGGNLSTLTVANGRVFVASIDTHDVYALNEASGDILWTFTADGRVDSPPTIYNGRVIFGCADGFVYCLRASDGEVIWKFQAAPENLRVTSFEQVESVWPLNGSVLLVNDEIYCVAGRHMFLDGGLRFLRIDPVTGGLIGEVVLDENDPNTGENLQVHIKGHQMPVALPDILSSDGEYVFMHEQRFDMQGDREEIEPFSANKVIEAQQQYGVGMHLFSPTAFLDDDYMHRTYWVWGRKFSTGAGGHSQNGKYAPAGRVMAIGPDKVYGYGRQDQYYKWSVPLEYELFCAEKYPESESIEYLWLDESVPLLANSIVLTDKILWVAGAPDVVDEVAAMEHWAMDPGDPAYDPNIPAKLAEQDAALNDERGGRLRAVLISDGSVMADYSIESLPIWDGMVAANG